MCKKLERKLHTSDFIIKTLKFHVIFDTDCKLSGSHIIELICYS